MLSVLRSILCLSFLSVTLFGAFLPISNLNAQGNIFQESVDLNKIDPSIIELLRSIFVEVPPSHFGAVGVVKRALFNEQIFDYLEMHLGESDELSAIARNGLQARSD